MSWQTAAAVASIAASAASVGGTVVGMAGAQGRGAANQGGLTAQGNSLRRQAGQLRDQANEVDTQVAIEEQQRLAAYEAMMASNRADLPTRGVTDSASFDAIMRHNQDAAGQDLLAVKYMGSAKASRLRANADAADQAADVFYKGGIAAMDQANTESAATLARGGWNLFSSMPNMVKSFGSAWNEIKSYTGSNRTSAPAPWASGTGETY